MFKFQAVFSLDDIARQCIGASKAFTLTEPPSIVGKHNDGLLIVAWHQKSNVI
jgi:hypothetical protein